MGEGCSNVLLIGINFYDYELRIKRAMERKGYYVDLVFVCDNLDNLHIEKYDVIVILVGRNIRRELLEELRRRKKNETNIILYLWDDVSYVNNFKRNRDLYDVIYSFDPSDCREYGLRFLPLFYDNDLKKREKKDIDVYCAITDAGVRLDALEKLVEKIEKNLNAIIIANVGKKRYLYQLIKRNRGCVKYRYKPIPKQMDFEYMSRAKSIIDIKYPTQTGLSTRVYEAMALKNKIITTNRSVIYYDFYNPDNIQIIDENQLDVDWIFLDKKYVEIDNDIKQKYCIDEWIDCLVGKKTNYYLIHDNVYGI